MKKTISIIAAAALLLLSCNPDNKVTKEEELSAKVAEVGLFSVSVEVSTSAVNSYFIKCYRASSFNGITADAVVNSLKKRIEDGETWADFLHFGPQSITFDNLSYGTEYKVLLFGLRGDGSRTGEPVVLDVTTDAFSAELKVQDKDYFGFDVEVKPNNDDIAWAPFVFTYDPYYDTQRGLKDKVMNELNNLTFGDIAFKGASSVYNICNPGMEAVFCVCAIDEDLNIISDIFAQKVEIPFDGFPILAEDKKDYGRVCLYTNDRIGIGAMIELYQTADDVFVIPIMDINSLSTPILGVDLFSDSDEKVEAFYASYAQAFYDSIVNDPQYESSIATMTPLEIMQACFYSTALFKQTYGTKWDPFTKEEIEASGEPLRNAVYSMCLIQMGEDGKIHSVSGTLARAKYSVE